MIVLQGQGDTQVCYVNKDTWDYILNGGTIPETQIQQYMKENSVTKEQAIEEMEPSGDHDNDRALGVCGDYGPGELGSNTFFDMTVAMKFARDNDIEVIASYSGYIY